MIYLASPYSHPEISFREERFARARKFMLEALRQQLIIFSPIVYCHELAYDAKIPTDADYWWNFNISILRHCTELWALKIEGWENSRGMRWEIETANHLHIPVNYVNLNHFDLADE